MIRILAGEKKGRVLRVAPSKAVRPTAANARQVLFDILGACVAESHWLDLYAGSGAVGLEALSRGAARSVFVESSRRCLAVIRTNIAHVGYAERSRVIGNRVEKALKWLTAELRTRDSSRERGAFDIIFLDPPYGGDEAARCLLTLGRPSASCLLRSPESIVVAQLSSRVEIRPSYGALALEREKRVGDTCLCFFALRPEASGQAAL